MNFEDKIKRKGEGKGFLLAWMGVWDIIQFIHKLW